MNIRQNLKKRPLLFRSKIGIFDIFLKGCMKKVLKIYRSIIIENFKTVPVNPIKWWPFKVFTKSHKSPLLIANIVKDLVSDLRQFLTTESPWKIMKNAFYFILKAIFVLKMFVLTVWSCGKNGLIRKMKLISKIMTSQPG